MASTDSLQEQKRAFTSNREFIVDNLDADDVIDELIQEKMMGRNAAQRVQLVGMSRVEKNRIIVDQLNIAGPGALENFCEILRRNKQQAFIAEKLEKCEWIYSRVARPLFLCLWAGITNRKVAWLCEATCHMY